MVHSEQEELGGKAPPDLPPLSQELYRGYSYGIHDDSSLNSLKALEEGAIDDLMSLGSTGHQVLASLSPESTDSWRLTNPVHMELQENAKLPTFNWSVDRTGSVDPMLQIPHFSSLIFRSSGSTSAAEQQHESGHDHQNQHASSSLKKPPPSSGEASTTPAQDPMDEDINWAELFLSNRKRVGYHTNYEQAGVLRHEPSRIVPQAGMRSSMHQQHQTVTTPTKEIIDPLNDLDIDPTPLSEIRRKAAEHHGHYQYRGAREFPLPVPGVVTHQSHKSATTATHQQQQQQQPGQASVGSTSTNSSLSVVNMADAVATAAAIAAASQQQQFATEANSNTGGVVATTSTGNRSLSALTPMATTAGRPRPNYNMPKLGTKHSVTSSFSQYGFGTRHVVPSVPAPPSSAKRPKNTSPVPVSDTNKLSRTTSPPVPRSVTSPSSNNNNDDASTMVAYERKKQKAKDARVKLNDSIDRLSIAMNLAGTQSKQRVQQWLKLPTTITSTGTDKNNNRTNGTTNTTSHQQPGLQIMNDCARTAEEAKKWDRPSFVGTAAILIHGLNSQCDALMRELVAVHETYGRGGVSAATATRAPVVASSSNGNNHSRSTPSLSVPNSINVRMSPEKRWSLTPTPSNVKRQRMTEVAQGGYSSSPVPRTTTTAIETVDLSDASIFAIPKIMERVSSFLDPLSIVRCRRVSKIWKETLSLASASAWDNLATSRFGYYSVRQWRDRVSDDNEEDTSSAATSMALYKSMDLGNVIPHMQHDGMLFLGEARLPGKVSAWTYLVERSNGETLRSVRREASMPGSGIYASLPVVELRTVVQNTGESDSPVILRKQMQTVDASTRRRGEEMKEIEWDERLEKRVLNLDGSPRPKSLSVGITASDELCQLPLFDVVVIVAFIFAKGCSTTSKFVQRSNFTKILVQISNGTTVPLVIPFPRDAVGLLH